MPILDSVVVELLGSMPNTCMHMIALANTTWPIVTVYTHACHMNLDGSFVLRWPYERDRGVAIAPIRQRCSSSPGEIWPSLNQFAYGVAGMVTSFFLN